MSDSGTQHGFISYLKSKVFLKQLLFIFASILLLLFLVQLWLRFYTHHGQKIQLPKLISMTLDDAKEKASESDFELVVTDSIFVVGKPGGIITDQNPKPMSYVKSGRKIYVTITKFGVETFKVRDLPSLYGNAFEQKKTELKYREIECVIKDYAYDAGEPNHILEVWYNGQLIISRDVKQDDVDIAKGGKLECVLSRRDGGDVTIPDLRCLDLEEARFLLQSSKLEMGDILKKGATEPDATLYIIAQSPPYDGISNMKMGEKVTVTVSSVKPTDCN
jgi:D-alanine-D-alanine ligase